MFSSVKLVNFKFILHESGSALISENTLLQKITKHLKIPIVIFIVKKLGWQLHHKWSNFTEIFRQLYKSYTNVLQNEPVKHRVTFLLKKIYNYRSLNGIHLLYLCGITWPNANVIIQSINQMASNRQIKTVNFEPNKTWKKDFLRHFVWNTHGYISEHKLI